MMHYEDMCHSRKPGYLGYSTQHLPMGVMHPDLLIRAALPGPLVFEIGRCLLF